MSRRSQGSPMERGAMMADGPRIKRRGILLVLSSPSGAGKTTLARRLVEADPNLSMSVSVTTRPPRPGESGGHDYHFVDQETFQRMREKGELLEWARVFDHLYGTPRAPVETAIAMGKDILFDIDWQGAQQLSEKLKHDVVRVFILPPRPPRSKSACASAPRIPTTSSSGAWRTHPPRSATGPSTTT